MTLSCLSVTSVFVLNLHHTHLWVRALSAVPPPASPVKPRSAAEAEVKAGLGGNLPAAGCNQRSCCLAASSPVDLSVWKRFGMLTLVTNWVGVQPRVPEIQFQQLEQKHSSISDGGWYADLRSALGLSAYWIRNVYLLYLAYLNKLKRIVELLTRSCFQT